MPTKQELALQQITNALDKLNRSNDEYKTSLDQKVETLSKKIQEKYTPIYLERDILNASTQAIQSAIKNTLEGYNSPLTKLIINVINSHETELKSIITESFQKVIRTEDFKNSIVEAFSHKISRSIINNQDGLFDKVSNQLKQDPIFRAKITTAVSNVVEECLKNPKT